MWLIFSKTREVLKKGSSLRNLNQNISLNQKGLKDKVEDITQKVEQNVVENRKENNQLRKVLILKTLVFISISVKFG